MNYDSKYFISDLLKDYKKLQTETKKKYLDIQPYLDTSIESLSALSKITSSTEFEKNRQLSSNKLLQPFLQITLSKHYKIYLPSLLLLKKLIEYNFLQNKNSADVTQILKSIFDQSQEENHLKIIEISLTLINSQIFNVENAPSITNMLSICLKAFSFKSNDFKNPIRLSLKLLTSLIFSQKSISEKSTVLLTLNIYLELFEGKKKEPYYASIITKCLALELIVTALNSLSIDTFFANKELKEVVTNHLNNQISKLFNSPLNNEILIGIKTTRTAFMLINKFHLGFEFIDNILKYSLSNVPWMKQIGLEGLCKILANSELIWIIYKDHIDLYKKILDTLNKISIEFFSSLNKEKEENKNAIFSKKKIIDIEEIFIENDDNGVGNINSNPKYINKLLIECYENLKNGYLAIMKKSDILVNQLNFNLSPEQNEKREMLNYESELIKNSLTFIIKTTNDDVTCQSYLSIFQSLTGIYSSIYLPLVRDDYLTNLCNLLLNNEDLNPKEEPKENNKVSVHEKRENYLKYWLKPKKVLICQTLLNLSHCINLLEVNSWVILITTLQTFQETLLSKGIGTKKEYLDVESLLQNTSAFIQQFSKDSSPVKEKEKTEHEENLIRLFNSIEALFIDSNIFDKETLCNVIFALSQVIKNHLISKKNSLIQYCMIKIYQIIVQNILRVELVFKESTQILETVFEKNIDKISSFSLDVISSMVISILSKFVEKPVSSPDYISSWGRDSFQRTTFNPLVLIASQSLTPENYNHLLDNMGVIVRNAGNNFSTFGWSSFIEISSIMINNNSEKTFDLVKLVLSTDYINHLTPYNIIPLLSLLGTFALYENDSNICCKAIDLFWSCANLTENFQKQKSDLVLYQKDEPKEDSDNEKSKIVFFNEIWKHIFFKLTNVNMDERLDVRESGIKVFGDIFISKIENISPENRVFIINEIFLKMIKTNVGKYRDCLEAKGGKVVEKNWEETAILSLLTVSRIVHAFINHSDIELVNKSDIYIQYLEISSSMISFSSPEVNIQILKSLNELQIEDSNPPICLLIEKLDYYWKIIDEMEKYLLSELFITKYIPTIDGLKLLFEIIDNFKKIFGNNKYIETYKNLLHTSNVEHFLKLMPIILSCSQKHDPKNFSSNPHKLMKIESEIFDFIDGCCEVATDDKSLSILYNYLFSFVSYDYEKPHTEALCKRSLLGLTTIYKNINFPYELYLNDLISTIKKLLLLRSQNEYVESIIKYNKNNSPLLFQTVSEQLIIIIKIYIGKLTNESIWNSIINIYESVFKQTEVGYKSIQRQYQEELMKSSMEMEIQIINFIVNSLIPNSLFLSQELQSKLLKLLDMGCNLDYSSFSNNATAISKICISNLFTLCKYKSEKEIRKEYQELVEEKTIEELIKIKIKIAKMCTPILIKRCRDMMRKFLDDEIKSGAMPLSRTRLEEIKFVLDKIKTLDVYPDFLDLEKKKNDNPGEEREICVMDVVSKSKKAHLFFLHPILAEFITTKENDIKMIIRDIFKLISSQMGIKDISLYS